MKVPFRDFIQNVSQALSMCIKVNKWNYLKNPSGIQKILFVLGSYEYLERPEGVIRKCLFFYVKIF